MTEQEYPYVDELEYNCAHVLKTTISKKSSFMQNKETDKD